jgi:uncharacterized protein (DUF1800 family)
VVILKTKPIDLASAWQPYSPGPENPWDFQKAAHLYRRAAFGGSKAEIDVALRQSPIEVINGLADSNTAKFDAESKQMASSILATGDPKQLAGWWTYVLLKSPAPLKERMTLFWHGHFATSAAKVNDPMAMLEQNQLLRKYALGDFRAMVHGIARDPAMLIFLDSVTNRKAHANENFARELMELFCLGEGNYSEKDVQELARCFTGWEIKSKEFKFNRFQHDEGEKNILAKQGKFPDGESIDWVLQQQSASRFIAGKLFQQFIWDEPAPPEDLLAPLAASLRSGWNIGVVVKQILASNLFFSPEAIGGKVRSPVDFGVGTLRSLEGAANAPQLADAMQQIGQGLFYPPNVKGWDGGRTWINASTILGRANLVAQLLSDNHTRFGGKKLDAYLVTYGAKSREEKLDLLEKLLLATQLAEAQHATLVGLAKNASSDEKATEELLRALVALPEYQLG